MSEPGATEDALIALLDEGYRDRPSGAPLDLHPLEIYSAWLDMHNVCVSSVDSQ